MAHKDPAEAPAADRHLAADVGGPVFRQDASQASVVAFAATAAQAEDG